MKDEIDLTQSDCVPCHGGIDPMTAHEIGGFMPMVPEWQHVINDGVDRLEREFSFKTYIDGAEFVQRVVALAEGEGHHPSIRLDWGKVHISWWTHKISGLHQNDFICAAKTSALL